MTNEEMALQVQAGNGKVFEELTRQNRGVVHRSAWKLWTDIGGDMNPLGAAYDDMVQLALLGLYGACMAYDPAKGFKLLSYLWRQMQGAFRDQYRQHRNDVLKEAISGDRDLSEGGDGFTLLDTVPSEAAVQAFEDSEEELWRQQARRDLEQAIDGLAPQPAAAVRQRYFEGQELRPIGEQLGTSTERARQIVQRGLQELRKSKQLKDYRALYAHEYTEAKAYRGTGLRAFRGKRASSVEVLTEKLEWLREFRGKTESNGLKQVIDREIAAVTARLAS